MTHALRTCCSGAIGFLLAMSWATVGHAQGSAADAQFDYGLAEMQAGRYETGCPALADSYRLDPKPGSLFTLAECEARWGKVSAALTHYEAYLDLFSRMTPDQMSRQKGREKVAAQKRDELRGRVATLTLFLSRAAPSGTIIKRDGVPLGPAALGAGVPVEPGDHVIEVSVPGRPSKIERVQLVPGESRRVVLDVPEAEREPASEGPPAPRAVADESRPPPQSDATSRTDSNDASSSTSSNRGQGYRIGALVAGGVGAVSIGIGTVFGVMTLGHKRTIDEHCRDLVCDAEGKRAADDAQSTGTVATAGFIIGGVGAATALVFTLLTPRTTGRAVHLRPLGSWGPGQGSVGVGGRF